MLSQLIIQSLRESLHARTASSENHVICEFLANLRVRKSAQFHIDIAILHTLEHRIRQWLRFFLHPSLFSPLTVSVPTIITSGI